MGRKLTERAKLELVLASFGKKGSNKEFCAKRGVALSTFYAWRDAFLTCLAEQMASKKSDRSV